MKKPRKPPPPPPEPKVTDDAPLRQRLAGLEALKKTLEAEEAAKPKPKTAPGAEVSARKPAPRAPEPQGRMTSVADVWRPDIGKDLFRVAMSGVMPLNKGNAAARQPGDNVRRGPGGRDVGGAMRRARAEGGETIPVRWLPDGTFEAARPGRSFALEALGRFAVMEHKLDLHGLDAVEAASRVGEFVRTRRARGARVVAIVHGSGKHSPDGTSVLRDVVVQTLAAPPVSRDVDAFRTADTGHGGAGVTVVSLRVG
ncbi:MAG: Smr/MutS family protein [Deltaproteobacteria bacterium]